MKREIAHVTAHVGGGIGAFLDGWLSFVDISKESHCIYCLDFAIDNAHLFESKFKFSQSNYQQDLRIMVEELNKYTAIILHYWNHPLMAKFIYQTKNIRTPILAVVHNSGLNEPFIIPERLLTTCTKIIFTTNISNNAPNLKEKIAQNPLKFIEFPKIRDLKKFHEVAGIKRPTPRNRLLYLGTVDEAKMHQNSAQLFAELSNLGFLIDVVGGNRQKEFSNQVLENRGRVACHGQVSDVLEFFKRSSIFVYPLRPDHYGTGEMVLWEAMASGLPVVCFDNELESSILEKMSPRSIARSVCDFVNKVKLLRDDEESYSAAVESSLRLVASTFNRLDPVESLNSLWDVVTIETSLQPISRQDQDSELDIFEIFVRCSVWDESIATLFRCQIDDIDYRKLTEPFFKKWLVSRFKSFWSSDSKGSPMQYLKYFGTSSDLREIVDMLVQH